MIGDAKWYLGGISSYTSSSNGLASHFIVMKEEQQYIVEEVQIGQEN